MSAPRDFGGRRLASRGEARWHTADGSFAYIELELLAVSYDGSDPDARAAARSDR